MMEIKKQNFLLTMVCLIIVSVFLSSIAPQYKNIITKCELVEVEGGEDDTEETNNDDIKTAYYSSLYVYVSIHKLIILNSFENVSYTKTAFLDVFSPPPELI